MKKMRLMAGVTALVLALGLLTACGQQEDKVEEETPVQEEQTEQTIQDDLTEEVLEPVEEDPVEEEEMPEEDSETEEPETESEDEDAEEEAEEAAERTVSVAELTEISEDGTMTVTLYAGSEDTESLIEDYTDVDFALFEATEQTQLLELHEDMLIYLVRDGLLEETYSTSLTEGCMLLMITEADGTEALVIYDSVAISAA